MLYAQRTMNMKRTQMSHRQLCPYTAVDLYAGLRDQYASASADLGGKKTEERGSPSSFRSTKSPF